MRAIDWNHLRAFHATAQTGSLSAAARQLGLTQPTLSRQVQALEADLGVPLFERFGRRLVLTQTGADLLEHIRSMGDAADSFMLAASGRVEDISGRVCISTTDTYCAYILPPILERIRVEAPRVSIALNATNEISNLHRREADIAIRHARPDRPGLVGEFVCETEAAFYASDGWIARNGMPKTLRELAGAHLIGFDDTERFCDHLNAIGIPMAAGDFRLVSDSSVAIWEMVRHGMGIAAMLCEIAERTAGVKRLLPQMPPISVPVWLVSHQELQSTPRIRLVQRILAEELARLSDR
ncbi:LysR family transcriptional regulator [uncultured Nitratireductor sp.]|uniref:LysR family transcriptional regulator n=1 Tax=uncultured Nitratireductor sp. TaxID=520953 RepID=UPI0025CE997D|nr:LysR family transcriptional regulator [uncultured Nitratireductor sp.]